MRDINRSSDNSCELANQLRKSLTSIDAAKFADNFDGLSKEDFLKLRSAVMSFDKNNDTVFSQTEADRLIQAFKDISKKKHDVIELSSVDSCGRFLGIQEIKGRYCFGRFQKYKKSKWTYNTGGRARGGRFKKVESIRAISDLLEIKASKNTARRGSSNSDLKLAKHDLSSDSSSDLHLDEFKVASPTVEKKFQPVSKPAKTKVIKPVIYRSLPQPKVVNPKTTKANNTVIVSVENIKPEDIGLNLNLTPADTSAAAFKNYQLPKPPKRKSFIKAPESPQITFENITPNNENYNENFDTSSLNTPPNFSDLFASREPEPRLDLSKTLNIPIIKFPKPELKPKLSLSVVQSARPDPLRFFLRKPNPITAVKTEPPNFTEMFMLRKPVVNYYSFKQTTSELNNYEMYYESESGVWYIDGEKAEFNSELNTAKTASGRHFEVIQQDDRYIVVKQNHVEYNYTKGSNPQFKVNGKAQQYKLSLSGQNKVFASQVFVSEDGLQVSIVAIDADAKNSKVEIAKTREELMIAIAALGINAAKLSGKSIQQLDAIAKGLPLKLVPIKLEIKES